MSDPDAAWQDRAACLGTAPELFFPPKGGDRSAITNAKAVCAFCPVREECLEYALCHVIKVGVWGGKSERERRRLRGQRARAAT